MVVFPESCFSSLCDLVSPLVHPSHQGCTVGCHKKTKRLNFGTQLTHWFSFFRLLFFWDTLHTVPAQKSNFSQKMFVGMSLTFYQGGKLTVMPRSKNGALTKIGVVWQKSDFWTKSEILGSKKGTHFWGFTMFWP